VRDDIEVGDRVRVRDDGRSAAAGEYAGETGRVTVVGPGLDRTIVDVRIDGKNVDTVFDEEDLVPLRKTG
jgi:hypothetical protein